VSVAALTGRGGTSGVGLQLLETGGSAIDLGRRYPMEKSAFGPSSSSTVGPPTYLPSLPAPSLSVVHMRFAVVGPSGARERAIFRKACPVPESETRALVALTYGQLVPALIESDEDALNDALGAMQDLGLKKLEWEAQDSITREFRARLLRAHPTIGLGLSSMGPTMFAMVSDPEPVLETIAQFRHHPVHVEVTRPSPFGMKVEHD
jgi:beta-ribofuranosylaminobenzene 5'-phosphate synthase